MTGTIVITRELLHHPIVGMHNPARMAAWIWMLSEARWKDGRVAGVDLKRGQFSHSIRHMAEVFGMSKTAVDRFLTRLKTGTLIETDTGTGQLVITICNYDKYQRAAETGGTAGGTAGGTQPGQDRDNKEKRGNKGKEDKPPISPTEILAEILPLDLAKDFVKHRAGMKSKLTERAARGVANSLREIQAAGLSPSQAIETAIERGWKTAKLDWVRNDQKSRGTGGNDKLANIIRRVGAMERGEADGTVDRGARLGFDGRVQGDSDERDGNGSGDGGASSCALGYPTESLEPSDYGMGEAQRMAPGPGGIEGYGEVLPFAFTSKTCGG